jgi:penicillin amidase
MRFVADMGNDAGAWFILPAGQSGNPLSSHYRDQFPLWQRGRLAWLRLAPDTMPAGATLLLTPRR